MIDELYIKNNEFRMRRNCLNCKHCISDLICDKDNEEIFLVHITQELNCCELSEIAKQNEKLMRQRMI